MYAPDQTISAIWHNARIATLTGAGYGLIERGALAVADGKIRWIGPMEALDLSGYRGRLTDCDGGLITPGLVDPHTHLVWGGNRAHEFALRQRGASYAEIARAGGGIRATVAATRALDEEHLLEAALPRAGALIREGVTTLEIKSGYGLDTETELKMLRVARRIGEQLPVRVRTTLLAVHALPPEHEDDADGYIDRVCNEMIPAAAETGLADAVDMFCERIAFTPAQCERVLEAAATHGLAVKMHAEQLSNMGGAALAARHGALSADHLEYLDETGIEALAEAGSVAVLLPGAYYYLRERQLPPVEQLRRAGVPIALASDLNPGSSPLASLRLMMNLAAVLFDLTPAESLTAVTRNAARALGLADRIGTLEVGKEADFLLWRVEHPDELTTSFGWQQPELRVLAGGITHV